MTLPVSHSNLVVWPGLLMAGCMGLELALGGQRGKGGSRELQKRRRRKVCTWEVG